MAAEPFDGDVFLIEQLIRPMVNLYQVSSDGRPVAFVRQKRMAIKEDIRFFADESETQELFRLKARTLFEVAGTYDVSAGDERIGALQKMFGRSLFRSTWRVLAADGAEVVVAEEQSLVIGLIRRFVDIPLPYHFNLMRGGERIGVLTREFSLRDRYRLDLSDDSQRVIDRRLAIALAIGLDALQSR